MPEAVIALKNIYLKNRIILQVIIKAMVAVGILLFILNTVNPIKIYFAFKKANILMILIACALSMLNIYLQYLKWKLVCNSLLKENDKKKIIRSLFYGFSGGVFTPARIGEYFGRAASFAEQPLLQVTSAAVIDKLFTLTVILIIGSVSFLFYLNLSSGLIGLLILSIILIYLIKKTGSNAFDKNILLTKLLKFKKISTLYKRLSFIQNINYKFRVNMVFLSALFYACFIFQFAILASAFTNHYHFLNYIWAGNLVMFTKSIIPAISFGELGIREGASVYFMKQVGETAAAGFNTSIFLFLINVLLPALVGLILIIKRR